MMLLAEVPGRDQLDRLFVQGFVRYQDARLVLKTVQGPRVLEVFPPRSQPGLNGIMFVYL